MRMYRRGDQRLVVYNEFGGIGPLRTVTVHHSAGPRARTKARCIELNRQYNTQHAAYGWGGIAYHLILDDRGRLYEGRPWSWKGAHTSSFNTGNFGIMIHGNFSRDRLNWRQRRTLKKLYRGKVEGMRFLGSLPWRGHQEQPRQATSCPGVNVMRYLQWLRGRGR